ncbi:uncharacterized protein LOC116717915 [Xiphophorus hellerii]|uniref:uncharacterized protein LOC116717915 n=1 Tax=Xiphophorus hellerii TaxID=8084 RepID=UPI0013B3738D|nr:uncharacterized protein LOC116717915 [Xiphophorus hellerii]
MQKPGSQQKMHVSICNTGIGAKIVPYCMNNKYYCPLCSYSADESYKVKNHIARTAVVQHNEFHIFRCGLPCRDTTHFHCPYCFSTIDRRDRFVNHLVNHRMTFHMVSSCAAAQPPVHLPATDIQATQAPVRPAATDIQATQAPVRPAATDIQATQAPVRSEDMITCEMCNLRLRKKNLRIHLKRKHHEKVELISQNHHLRSQCVDAKKGVFAVQKSFCGPSKPIHVIKNTWSQFHRSECELDRCNVNAQFAKRSGILPFECEHIQSLRFCPRATDSEGPLSETTLNILVDNLWFSVKRKEELLKNQQEALSSNTPFSVLLFGSGTDTTFHVSIFEPKMAFFSRLGRVIVTYDKGKNTWHCACTEGKRSCTHKATAKWHLFEKMPDMFKAAVHSEEDVMCGTTVSECQEESGSITDDAAERIIKYLIYHKKIPADLPDSLITRSRDAKSLNGFPKHLIPSETECTECGQHASLGDPQLLSSTAKIVTLTGVVKGISTYRKTCPNCSMVYRYQDWEDGIHNFNDHLLLSIHFCLVLRNALQTHTAVSRIIETIEYTEGENFPFKDRILQAYLSFEGLSDHDYQYSCDSCGYHPAIVVMDLHKKGVFSMPVSEIPNPPQQYNGEVNARSFWEAVTMEVISRGLYPPGCKNPFVVKPTYHNWSPWIGPQTRRSDILINTESEKVHLPDSDSDVDQFLTEERLADEVLNLKLPEIRRLCSQCGIDSRGSKMDLVLRLRDKMASRATYNKVFEKVWGASGGWAVITCPCGIIYSVKFNLRAESPRDFADLLLSWKFFPNITVYDYPRGLVSHLKKRCAKDTPFTIHDGRLVEATPENIRQATEKKLAVNLPWLKHRKEPEDKGGHPVTGSLEHYCLSDVFHQGNSKDEKDVLRKIEMVPELAGRLNSQCAEQLFAGMRKNNYFLNMLNPSTHIFLQRNILHHFNLRKNTKTKQNILKVAGPHANLVLDKNGCIIMGCEKNQQHACSLEASVIQTHQCSLDDSLTSLQTTGANKFTWTQKPNNTEITLLAQVLDQTRDPAEYVACVDGQVLTRGDMFTLGLSQDMNGQILNSCLKVVERMCINKGIKVFAGNSHVVHTWFPPLSLDPAQHLPPQAQDLDWVLIPVWHPGHWTLCILKPKHREIFFLDSINGTGFTDENRIRTLREVCLQMSSGPWTEFVGNDVEGLPKQGLSNNCGMFVVMYALYFVMGASFDFSENDMMTIRRWWSLTLLTNFPVKSREELQKERKRKKVEEREKCETLFADDHNYAKATEAQIEVQSIPPILQMPLIVLEAILQEVILAQGDTAYLTLALTCKSFEAIVSDPVFRKKTHFAWLDGEINWENFSESFKAENRIPFAVIQCSSCNRQYKDSVGFTGHGRRGEFPRYYCDGIPGHCPECQY